MMANNVSTIPTPKGNFFTGTPGSIQQIPRFNPQQMQWQNQIGQQSMQGLMGTDLNFAPIGQRIMNQFQTETVPTLLERLQAPRGSYSAGGRALGGQLGGALRNLGMDLGAQESQYNLNRYNALLGGLGMGMQPQQENLIFGAQPGMLQSAAPAAGYAAAAGGMAALKSAIPWLMALL